MQLKYTGMEYITIYNFSIQETEAGRLQIQGQIQVQEQSSTTFYKKIGKNVIF